MENIIVGFINMRTICIMYMQTFKILAKPKYIKSKKKNKKL